MTSGRRRPRFRRCKAERNRYSTARQLWPWPMPKTRNAAKITKGDTAAVRAEAASPVPAMRYDMIVK